MHFHLSNIFSNDSSMFSPNETEILVSSYHSLCETLPTSPPASSSQSSVFVVFASLFVFGCPGHGAVCHHWRVFYKVEDGEVTEEVTEEVEEENCTKNKVFEHPFALSFYQSVSRLAFLESFSNEDQ